MRCLISSAAVAVLSLTLGAALAADKKDEKKDDKKPAAPASTDYTSLGEINVTLASSPDEKGGSISIKVPPSAAQMLRAARGKGKDGKDAAQDMSLDTTSDAKVRRMHLPPKINDKGVKVQYTEKELRELKGDTTLRGYEANFKDLQAGMTVTVHLVKMKGAAPDAKPMVNRIYILTEPPKAPEKQDKKPAK
jgi:hypothetical protein